MHANPSVALVLSAILGILAAIALIAVGAIWARVRSIPLAETTRLVDDLSRQQQSIEALLNRLEADRELGQEQVQGRGSSRTHSTLPNGPTSRLRTSPRADRPESSAVGGPTLIAVPSLAASSTETSAEAAAELGRRFGAIWALAHAGESAEAISRATGQPIGQVELILGLRRQLISQPAAACNSEGRT